MNKNINFLYQEFKKNYNKNLNFLFKSFLSFYFDKKYKEDENLLNEITNITNDYDKNYLKDKKLKLEEIENESKIILFNGKYIYSEKLDDRITVKEDVKEKKKTIKKNLNLLSNNLNFFYIMNEILSKNNLFIEIPKDFFSEKQLYILNIIINDNNYKINTFSNIYIELKENSKININKININISKNIFNNSNLILNINKLSKLNYNFKNYSFYESISINSIFSFQEKKSLLLFEDFFIKEQKIKTFYNFFMKGDYCEFKKKSLRYLEKNSFCETICKIFHLNSNSKSDSNFYAIGKDEVKCVFQNNVFVDIDNNFIDAKVKVETLAISDKSEFILMPELDINSSNIKCSHAATIGTLNDKILNYMMSRGLSKEECIKIIIESFLIKNFDEKIILTQNMIKNI